MLGWILIFLAVYVFGFSSLIAFMIGARVHAD